MKAEIVKRYSCRRKRDFITFSAIAMFLLLVAFQLYLTMVVPVQLKNRGALEENVAKLEMLRQMDFLRDSIPRIKPASDIQCGEVAMVSGVLDSMARYVRAERDRLTLKDIFLLKRILGRYEAIIFRWKEKPQPRYFITKERIDSSVYLKTMEADIN